MERNVVEIYKSIDVEMEAKVKEVKERTCARLHELAEEHQETIAKFAESLTDEEFVTIMKSDEIDLMDKEMIVVCYACRDNK